VAYVLAYSVIMLNTDAHNPQARGLRASLQPPRRRAFQQNRRPALAVDGLLAAPRGAQSPPRRLLTMALAFSPLSAERNRRRAGYSPSPLPSPPSPPLQPEPPQVKVKMTVEGFIRNNRGINDGADLPEDFMRALYDR
jgi:hypothetical protein